MYTKQWFQHSSIRRLLPQQLEVFDKTLPHRILEIGAFEGQSTVWFLDTIITQHPESKLVTVDPFDITDRHTPVTSQVEQRFVHNVNQSRCPERCIHYKLYSVDYFALGTPDTFTIIYIDGSHETYDMYRDVLHAWRVLEPGGILWIDDYMAGQTEGRSNDAVQRAVDHALIACTRQYPEYTFKVLFKGYQYSVQKVIS